MARASLREGLCQEIRSFPKASNKVASYCCFRFGVKFLVDSNTPSICSKRSCSMCPCIGSKTKSIPSLRASLEAGTKSESPENKTILSTSLLNESDAMSTPIFISMPFCLKSRYISSSVRSSNEISFFSSLLRRSGLILHPPSLSLPILNASFRFLFRALIRSTLNL